MQKMLMGACALALSTTLAFAAEPTPKQGDAMGDTSSMQATPKPGASSDAMGADAMSGQSTMGAGDSMQADDKMMKNDDKMSK